MYYFVINLFCHLDQFRIDKTQLIKIKYEDLVSRPEGVLEAIQCKFGLDLSEPINFVRNNSPLKTGFPFNGNRIRLKKEVTLRKQDIVYRKSIKNLITRIINGVWY